MAIFYRISIIILLKVSEILDVLFIGFVSRVSVKEKDSSNFFALKQALVFMKTVPVNNFVRHTRKFFQIFYQFIGNMTKI